MSTEGAQKRKRSDSSSETQEKSVLNSAEISFPRGGSSILTPLEVKEIANEAARDVLFENQNAQKSKPAQSNSNGPSKKKSKKSKNSIASIVEDSTSTDAELPIDHLSLKKLLPGTIVLGQIMRINKMEIILSIADNLNGYIPITSISDELTTLLEAYDNEDSEDEDEEENDIVYDNDEEDSEKITNGIISTKQEKKFPNLNERFVTGQWLRAVVVEGSSKNKTKKRIQLSIEPNQVNKGMDEDEDMQSNAIVQASVKSVEDHGLILNLPVNGSSNNNKNGFISKKELQHGSLEFSNINVGSVLLVSIGKDNGRTFTCKIPNGAVKKQPTVSTISSIDAILPGMLVDALIKEVTKDGLICKVFGLCDATINIEHIGIFELSELKHKFAIGSNIKARIVASYLRSNEKRLYLSLLPHLQMLQLKSYDVEKEAEPLKAFPIGHIFDLVTIKGRDSDYIYVDVGSSVPGQAHISRISENSDIDMDFKIGSTCKARILGYSLLDNYYILTLDSKQIERKYLRADDIPAGARVSAEIVKVITDGGIQVKIEDQFDALVPQNHMSDIKLIYPERKFKIGQKVKARVLRVTNNGGKTLILVTLKKSLVSIDNETVIASIDDVEVGKRTVVTVEKLLPTGCVVNFFGFLKAFLPNSEISETFVKRPEDHVKLGQTVKVRVLTVDKEKHRVKVTCRISDVLSTGQKKSLSTLVPGRSIVKVSIVEREKDSIVVELVDSHVRGVIYAGQLLDGNFEQCRAALKKLQVGSEIEALVLEKDSRARIVKLSTKPSLLEDAKSETLPTSYKDISISNKPLHGFVKSVTNTGVFVAFGNNLTGLVLPRYASDKQIKDLTTAFYLHQSVTCHVIRLDDANKRFLLSFKTDDENDSSNQLEAVNPIDEKIKTLKEFVPGVVTKAKIRSIKGTQLNVQLADNQQGRVDITELFDSFKDIKDKKKPLSQFTIGDILDVKIIGYHDARNHKFLPISHKKTKQSVLELSARKSILESDKFAPSTISDLKEGDKCIAYINNFARGYLWVSVSPTLKGRISLMDLSNDASKYQNLQDEYPVGFAFEASVLSADNEKNILSLSARENAIKSIEDVKVGDVVPARVLKTRESYVVVELGSNVTAVSFITDALNNYSEKIDSIFSTNDICAATILSIDEPNNKIYVSLRTKDAKDKCISSFEDLKSGDVVRGFVKNVSDKGLYVSLGREVYALVRVSDLSDSFLKDWKKFFKVHQPIIGKIVSSEDAGRVLMTLKDSEVNGELSILKLFDQIEVGEIYEGSVRRVTDFGVFVKLDGAINVTGLCHHSQISDNKVEDISSIFGEGDRVKVKILAVDKEKKQLSLGMKASYFIASAGDKEDDETSDVEMEEDDEAEDEAEDKNSSDDEDALMDYGFASNEKDSDDEDEDAVDEEMDEDNDEAKDGSKEDGLTASFGWDTSILTRGQFEEEEDSDDEFETCTGKKSKKSRKQVEDKTADINARAPESVSDYERLILGNPDSSALWISYMGFQLSLSEYEKAREIGERALKTINYREEQEKLNIYTALLNLELAVGTDDSLDEVFKRSCQYMEPFVMHQRLVSIYLAKGEESGDYEKAEELYKVMLKKFGSSNVSVWIAYGALLLEKKNDSEGAHEILAKALQVLPKRDNVEVVRKFAQLEFNKGDPEQGRSLFEGLLADVPKRIDLWNVYIDQEMKIARENVENKKKVEELFERVITKKLTRKQAKFFFGKWLAFEELNEDNKAVEYVKSKAAEFAQKLSDK